MKFLDEIQEFPKVCVVAGDEAREYQPNEFKWRFLSIDIRVYVEDQDDPQEVLALLMEDIERVVDNNDVMIYDDTVSPHLKTTSLTLQSMSTDEGVLAPLGIGELTLECRY
jgi:ferredoxin-fold anticodon binding domain-containing protein